MHKTIAITVLALLFVAGVAWADTTDFVASSNITVTGVAFGSGIVDMLIMSGSKAASWTFNSSTFTVTNPDATANFTVGSSDSSVKSIKISNSGGTVVACTENASLGVSYATAPTAAGTYTIEPSTAIDCRSFCTSLTGAATYNTFPTCGAATCSANYYLSGSGASAICLFAGGGVAGGGGGGSSVASMGLPSPSPSASPSPSPTPSAGVRSDGSLVRYAGDTKVYVIENGQKRWIQTAEDFAKLGYNWNSVIVVPSTESYTSGAVKTPSAQAAVTLIRYAGDPKVYVIENSQKRWVKTAADFTKLGYKWSDVKIAPSSETYSTGTDKTAATVSVPTSLTKTLKKGSSGAEVQLLQEKLKTLGYFPSDTATTNYFGNTTLKAVKDFQQAKGLSPTGTVDAKTRNLLNK
jgi:hypothetical protein